MGAMITYGSYLDRKASMPLAGASVALFDTGIALLSGFIIFPALFAEGADPSGGPGLVFVVMPTIFDAMPMGSLFGIAFYVLLATAALTSTVSILEVVVSYFVDERGMGREAAVWMVTGGCLLLAIPSALSLGAVDVLSALPGLGMGFLDLQDKVWGNYSLAIGALSICVFTGWMWGVKPALTEIEASGDGMPLSGLWTVLVRFVCPLAVGALLLSIIYNDLAG